MDIKKRIIAVLTATSYMSLGTLDDGGVWVADVTFVSDDDMNIYWISDQKVRHSVAIEKNQQSAATVTASNKPGDPNLGIQIEGIVEKIEGNDRRIAELFFKKNGKPMPADEKDILKGRSWYVLHPNKIQLIDKENFGFNKQTIQL